MMVSAERGSGTPILKNTQTGNMHTFLPHDEAVSTYSKKYDVAKDTNGATTLAKKKAPDKGANALAQKRRDLVATKSVFAGSQKGSQLGVNTTGKTLLGQ